MQLFRRPALFTNGIANTGSEILLRIGRGTVHFTDLLHCRCGAGAILGQFADKYGRRRSLLRAQLGLAAGFALCGLSAIISQCLCLVLSFKEPLVAPWPPQTATYPAKSGCEITR
ncbi:hypothetical protein O9929_24760 [Vibrio lentus]|nr:hypothetical protein [Vibrio lentus]